MNPLHYAGLDISLTSPAIAVLKADQTVHALCFKQRKSSKAPKCCDRIHITEYPAIPCSKNETDLVRYKHITSNAISWLCQLIPAEERRFTLCKIEGYVYCKSAHNYKLHELTGVLKYSLFNLGFILQETVPVTNWKKKLTSNAFADKYEVLLEINRILQIKLEHLFDVTLGKEKLITRKRKYMKDKPKTTRNVPCPVQDVSDALGIIASHMNK